MPYRSSIPFQSEAAFEDEDEVPVHRKIGLRSSRRLRECRQIGRGAAVKILSRVRFSSSSSQVRGGQDVSLGRWVSQAEPARVMGAYPGRNSGRLPFERHLTLPRLTGHSKWQLPTCTSKQPARLLSPLPSVDSRLQQTYPGGPPCECCLDKPYALLMTLGRRRVPERGRIPQSTATTPPHHQYP